MGRYLWYSNAPHAGTGYGEQTKLVAERMLRDKHQLAIAANYGISGAVMGWQTQTPDGAVGAPVLPQGYDQYSNDVVRAHYDAFAGQGGPATLIGLYDAWVIQPGPLKDIPVAWWTPVDHDPCPPQVSRFFVESGALPVAMSKFGQERLRAAGLSDVRYIPHAVDRAIHRPGLDINGQSVRAALRVPDGAFLVVSTVANKGAWPPRKAFGEMFQAMARLMAEHADTYWYLHTEPKGAANGIDLFALARAVGLPEDRLRWADSYAYVAGQIPPTVIAAIHGAADVMLMPSMGEGFGVPQVEAMATGTPVIASDATAQTEIVGGVGWLVEGQPWWDHLHSAFFHMPYIDRIVDALEEAYAERGTPAAADRRQRALARAAEYDADSVWETGWRPLLAELDERAKRHALRNVVSTPKPPVNTALRPKRKKRAA